MSTAFHARPSGDTRIHWLAGRWLADKPSLTTSLQANHDIKVTGSNVVATGDTTLQADHDIAIESATEQHDETHFKKKTKSGLRTIGDRPEWH